MQCDGSNLRLDAICEGSDRYELLEQNANMHVLAQTCACRLQRASMRYARPGPNLCLSHRVNVCLTVLDWPVLFVCRYHRCPWCVHCMFACVHSACLFRMSVDSMGLSALRLCNVCLSVYRAVNTLMHASSATITDTCAHTKKYKAQTNTSTHTNMHTHTVISAKTMVQTLTMTHTHTY